MCKLVVAVCDSDEVYLNRFVTYLVEHKAQEFTVHGFSIPDVFLEVLEQKIFDVVLLGHGFQQAGENVMRQKSAVLLLKDTMPERLSESGYQEEGEREYIEVFRYQSIKAILHEMQVLTGRKGKSTPYEKALASGMEVIGVYSPIKHEMQVPFSIVFSALLAEKRKVLYINLMKYTGLQELLLMPGAYDIGDIVLRLRNHRLLPETFLRGVYEMERIYYIPPFVNPENLHEFTIEDYQAFLGFLDDCTDFKTVVIDFGEGLAHLGRMLESCTSIFCPVKSGFFYECQKNEFLQYLEKTGESDVAGRLHLAELPFSAKKLRSSKDTLKQLLWSEFGDYVRDYLGVGGI